MGLAQIIKRGLFPDESDFPFSKAPGTDDSHTLFPQNSTDPARIEPKLDTCNQWNSLRGRDLAEDKIRAAYTK
jgi:hypothetical protein